MEKNNSKEGFLVESWGAAPFNPLCLLLKWTESTKDIYPWGWEKKILDVSPVLSHQVLGYLAANA